MKIIQIVSSLVSLCILLPGAHGADDTLFLDVATSQKSRMHCKDVAKKSTHVLSRVDSGMRPIESAGKYFSGKKEDPP